MSSFSKYKAPTPRVISELVEMPAGAYYIGDPCYVIPHGYNALWAHACNTWFDGMGRRSGRALIRKGEDYFVAFDTFYGDGSYPDQNGRTYGVDSGHIGAVPMELVKRTDSEEKAKRCGHIVTFDKPFRCFVDKDKGVITLGDIVIDTKGDLYGPEDEEDDDA